MAASTSKCKWHEDGLEGTGTSMICLLRGTEESWRTTREEKHEEHVKRRLSWYWWRWPGEWWCLRSAQALDHSPPMSGWLRSNWSSLLLPLIMVKQSTFLWTLAGCHVMTLLNEATHGGRAGGVTPCRRSPARGWDDATVADWAVPASL